MNRWVLLKQMLPGLLPLFVFVVVDEVWGTETGLYVAVSFGVVEVAVVYVRDRKFDRFILGDTALLVALGAVSLFFENDIFFKLKPALIEGILCAVVGISAFSSRNIIFFMSRRYMKNLPDDLSEMQMQAVRRPMRIMFYILVGHIALVVYAAFYMSRESWAFISGVLFYGIFGVFFIAEIAIQKIRVRRMRN